MPTIDELRIQYMTRFMETAAYLGMPIIFKGAMVLMTVVTQQGFPTHRITKDVDGDWITPNITNATLYNSIVKIVANMGVPNLSVKQTREFSETRSAGFRIYLEDKILFEFDLNTRVHPFRSRYKTEGNVEFSGAPLEKMYADKLVVLSTDRIFRRAKDLYDLYLLAHLGDITTQNICIILNELNYTLGTFDVYSNTPQGLEARNKLEHAYNKLVGVTNKPDFNTTYGVVELYTKPFREGWGYTRNSRWLVNPNNWTYTWI